MLYKVQDTTHAASIPNTGQEISDYSVLLERYKTEYRKVDYYFQVGQVSCQQGWIIHVSVILSDLISLLTELIPYLIYENVCFKIVSNKETAQSILEGFVGIEQLGKLIHIYPKDDRHASRIASDLIEKTKRFKGPSIPTDLNLGGVIYTRYGGFDPIMKLDEYGKIDKYIYNSKGQLVKDSYNIPFRMPVGITWPFEKIDRPIVTTPKKILNSRYWPVSILKADVRGNVIKCIYFDKFPRIRNCVIKQGRDCMISDESGRDIKDRLLWQQELHEELKDIIPIPVIIDFFYENKDAFLVMEYIKGRSLIDALQDINKSSECWRSWDQNKKLSALQYVIDIGGMLDKFHQNGYVHRDIAPGNFLIDKKNKIWLIDNELAYSFKKEMPYPPFTYGTPGFISPEQKASKRPTVEEDIYGYGALMLFIFTSLSPAKFYVKESNELADNLFSLIGDLNISNLIAECLSIDRSQRPDFIRIKKTLEYYQQEYRDVRVNETSSMAPSILSLGGIREVIQKSIHGLSQYPTIMKDGLWYSKTNNNTSGLPEQREYSKYPGLWEGMGGVLYVLAITKTKGVSFTFNSALYYRGLEYLNERHIAHITDISPGLYFGTAGIAVSIAEGIRNGLIEKNDYNSDLLYKCIQVSPDSLDIERGVAGVGVAVLRCAEYLKDDLTNNRLLTIVSALSKNQGREGNWANRESNKNNLSFDSGAPGIIWFLLSYIQRTNDLAIQKSIIEGLNWIKKQMPRLKTELSKKNYHTISTDFDNARKGVILTLLKAYEVFRDQNYLRLAEELLYTYPEFLLRNDFTLNSGMAGLGELYVEAWKVSRNNVWRKRIDWIQNIFMRTYIKESDCIYWRLEENNMPTADLMTGTSGIIHFLMRSLYPFEMNYPIIS